jgi:hypothetical protein
VFNERIILQKIFTVQFYRLNASFFLLVGTLAFGFMSKIEHIALAQFFVSSPVLTLIPVSIWTVYMIKVFRFNRQAIKHEENRFLVLFPLMPPFTRNKNLLLISISQMMPVILYGAFLLMIATQNKMINVTVIATSALASLVIMSSALLSWALSHINDEFRITSIEDFFNKKFTRSLFIMYAQWTMKREPFTVFSTKFFTCIFLFGVLSLYSAEAYDLRLLSMAVVLTSFGTMMIVQNLQSLEHNRFQILRNFPLKLWRRLIPVTLSFVLLSIPEMTVIVKYFPRHLSLFDFVQIMIYIISIQLFIYGLLYTRFHHEQVLKIVFVSVVLSFGLILFKVPVWILMMITATAGLTIYLRNYYRYESAAD